MTAAAATMNQNGRPRLSIPFLPFLLLFFGTNIRKLRLDFETCDTAAAAKRPTDQARSLIGKLRPDRSHGGHDEGANRNGASTSLLTWTKMNSLHLKLGTRQGLTELIIRCLRFVHGCLFFVAASNDLRDCGCEQF